MNSQNYSPVSQQQKQQTHEQNYTQTVFHPASSPVIEGTDEEEDHDGGVYGMNKQLSATVSPTQQHQQQTLQVDNVVDSVAVALSSDSNLYSLDDEAQLFDHIDDDDEATLLGSNLGNRSPSSSVKTACFMSSETEHLATDRAATPQAAKRPTSSSKRCQCLECRMVENQLGDSHSKLSTLN